MMVEIDIRKKLQSGHRVFNLHVSLATDAERIVITGASGSGKTLTLKAVAGLLRPDSGHIRFDGSTFFSDIENIRLPPQRRSIAYMSQEYALFPHLTIRQNVAFSSGRGWRNPEKDMRHEEVERWLGAFGLDHLAHQYPDEISGGQKQRTALARALVSRPRLLLLDEPFAALDHALRSEMRRELDALQRQISIPMIIVSHDPEDAKLFGEAIVSFEEGRGKLSFSEADK